MKKPNKKDYEIDSHGAFGEYEMHFDSRGYADALELYLEFIQKTGDNKII